MPRFNSLEALMEEKGNLDERVREFNQETILYLSTEFPELISVKWDLIRHREKVNYLTASEVKREQELDRKIDRKKL